MADEPKQEPATSKKEKSGLPVPIFGLVGFVVVLIVLVVNLFMILAIKSEVKSISEAILTGNLPIKEATQENAKKEKSIEEDEDDPLDNVGKYVADENANYFETGRITTNPRMSSSFVVINLGVFFKEKEKKDAAAGQGNKEAKSNETAGFSPFGRKFDGMLRNIVNSQIGSMSLEELQIPRDSMSKLFKERLRPLFRQQDAQLKDVAIVEFIIQ